MDRFTDEELNVILAEGLRLVLGRYVSGVNFIQSPNPLPSPAVLLHYLQDSKLRITEAEQALTKNGVRSVVLPRRTFYRFEPKYSRKENFLEEYANSSFINAELQHAKAPEVKVNPYGWCVQADELNLLADLDGTDISRIVALIYDLELKGEERWMDPAFIVKGKHPYQ